MEQDHAAVLVSELVLADKVARGVALLDERVPDWRSHVNRDGLYMRSGLASNGVPGCVLAQLNRAGMLGEPYGATSGSWIEAAGALWPESTMPTDDEAVDHGFSLPPNHWDWGASPNDWEALTALWIKAINRE